MCAERRGPAPPRPPSGRLDPRDAEAWLGVAAGRGGATLLGDPTAAALTARPDVCALLNKRKLLAT